jgi:hypothetical protein
VEGSGGRPFDLLFPSPAALGTWTLVLGPDIRDPFGNPLGQPDTATLT